MRPTRTAADAAPHRAEPRPALPAPNGTRTMHLIPEAMARSHMAERILEAESQRTAYRLAAARRLERRAARLHRRAEQASLRARRALARVLMH